MKFTVYKGGSNILVSERENNRVEDGGEEDREVGWEARGGRREDLCRSATGVVGKQKSTVTSFTLGQLNAEKEEDEGTSSKEYEPEGKNEFRTRRVEMPPFDGLDPDEWLS